MEFLPTPAGQVIGFFYSAGLGFCLGFIYDLFRIFFYLLTGSDKKFSVVRDIIFMLFLTAANFIFILVICSGRMMTYIFAGQIIGLLAYFHSLSDIVFNPVKQFLCRIRNKILNILTFLRSCITKFSLLLQNNEKNAKKSEKFLQKYLKIRHKL